MLSFNCISIDVENSTLMLIIANKIDLEVYSILPKNRFIDFHQKNGFIVNATFF